MADSETKKKWKVLISAYACEPYKGSEPGVGWNWALSYRSICEVWVLTRKNNKAAIESWEEKHGKTGIHWLWVDWPSWILRIKKLLGYPGILIYYWLWQFLAAKKASQAMQKHGPFSWIHQLTMNGFREPGRLDRLKAPLVWGPIGGLQNARYFFPRLQGRKEAFFELARSCLNNFTKYFSWRPIQAAKKRALILGANYESILWLRKLTSEISCVQLIEAAAPAIKESLEDKDFEIPTIVKVKFELA